MSKTNESEANVGVAGQLDGVIMLSKKGDRCLGNFGTDDEFQCGSFADGGGDGSIGIFGSRRYPGTCEYLDRLIDGYYSPDDCPYKERHNAFIQPVQNKKENDYG